VVKVHGGPVGRPSRSNLAQNLGRSLPILTVGPSCVRFAKFKPQHKVDGTLSVVDDTESCIDAYLSL
jgi:hypothetical protein